LKYIIQSSQFILLIFLLIVSTLFFFFQLLSYCFAFCGDNSIINLQCVGLLENSNLEVPKQERDANCFQHGENQEIVGLDLPIWKCSLMDWKILLVFFLFQNEIM